MMRKGACGVESGESGGQVSTHVRGRPVLSVPPIHLSTSWRKLDDDPTVPALADQGDVRGPVLRVQGMGGDREGRASRADVGC